MHSQRPETHLTSRRMVVFSTYACRGQAVTVLPLDDLLASYLRRGRPVANDDQNGMPRIGPERSPSGERDDVQHGPWTLNQRAAAQARADEPPGGPGRDEDQGRSDLRGTASAPNPYGPPDDLGSANPYGTIRYDPL